MGASDPADVARPGFAPADFAAALFVTADFATADFAATDFATADFAAADLTADRSVVPADGRALFLAASTRASAAVLGADAGGFRVVEAFAT